VKHWSVSQINKLRRLREGFLDADTAAGDYWQTPEYLELYDATFGERIGWKWDAVLSELSLRGWTPRSRHLVDFGCGSGIAGRRVALHWPERFASLTVHDRSRFAMRYASNKAREIQNLEIREAASLEKLPEDSLLLISHVLNELPAGALEKLLNLCRQAREILWVEAGTHADSRRLLADVREPLIASGEYAVIAPCTHRAKCGLLAAKNARHWCHNFACPPSAVFQDARWAEFSRELGIDLRSIPYSFLTMTRTADAVPEPLEVSRVIGEPREYKGFSKVLSCQAKGVEEFTLQKRDAPELFRSLKDIVGTVPCFRWEMQDGRIAGGEPLVSASGE